MKDFINIVKNPASETWQELLRRPAVEAGKLENIVTQIFEDVKTAGDSAVKKYTLQFDGTAVEDFRVSDMEIEKATFLLSEELKEAIQLAKQNIEQFHASQKTERKMVETSPGVICWQEKKPIQKVGLYIPGGTAPLFSTVLMLAIPAKIAGCEEIILCSPPDQEGSLHPAILYTAKLCGVSKIFRVGGIQAVAAMTFGTESIPEIYKIFGPGNQYVTAAKQLALKKGVAIDLPAGPSELLVVADETAKPAFVAADLLSQAEHGTDSQVILVSGSSSLLNDVKAELLIQLQSLPRKNTAEASLKNSKFILMEDDINALRLINEYGPEHLIICIENEQFYKEGVVNAGSVFLGNYSPESAGDYASGTNHTLPTGGYAKQYSGVNLDSFQKAITFQKISEEGLAGIGSAIELMAEAEGLVAHRNAVSIRLNNFIGKKDEDI